MIAAPIRCARSTNNQELALVAADKIAVALPVLPGDLKSPAILEILRLLKAGLNIKGGA